MIKLNRKKAALKKVTDADDNYVDLTPAQRVSFLSQADLIRNKQSTGRSKDLMDVEYLKKREK